MIRQAWRLMGWMGVAIATATHAGTLVDDFSIEPASNGWSVYGDGTLFRWDEARGALQVTWDSSRTNSYLAHPLGTFVRKTDDFALEFDLQLEEIAVGTTAGKPYTFQIALGFINLADATKPSYLRGTGLDSPNLVEFDYFPDSGFGATVSPTFISQRGRFASGFTFPVELTTGSGFHVKMRYTASNRTLTTALTKDGQPFLPVNDVVLGADFDDVAVDHVAVMSYSDAGQDPMFAGSVRARGWVDNLVVTVPDVPIRTIVGTLAGGRYVVPLGGAPGWLYTLERSTDLSHWEAAAEPVLGVGERQILVDEAPPRGRAFYRVRADKP